MQSPHRRAAVQRSLRPGAPGLHFRRDRVNGSGSTARPCFPHNRGFFCEASSGTKQGYKRTVNSILGRLTILSEQAKLLGLAASSRLSPYLEMCCLRLSATLSYEKTQEEVEVQTGCRVSMKTQQRLVHRQAFEVPHVSELVTQMSLDGGTIRIRTPKGQACDWREYKALNLAGCQQGMAYFKENDALLKWANDLPLDEFVDCLGDGHDGVWGIYACIGNSEQRHEILDWFHLVENLYKLPESDALLGDVKELLWYGEVDDTLTLIEAHPSEQAHRFRGYLERHRDRIPNYDYYQAEGIPIGSGDVESLVKQINARTKIAGAAWERSHVPQVLAHRCAYLNGKLSPESIFLSRK